MPQIGSVATVRDQRRVVILLSETEPGLWRVFPGGTIHPIEALETRPWTVPAYLRLQWRFGQEAGISRPFPNTWRTFRMLAAMAAEGCEAEGPGTHDMLEAD